jgi:hypothetical protein
VAEPDSSPMMTILRELRADMRQQRTLLLQVAEATHRFERRFGDVERPIGDVEGRISDLRPQIELMLKAESLSRLARFDTRLDEQIAELEDQHSRPDHPHS